MCGVYMILCKPTGEFYIGGTTLPFETRFSAHRSRLRSGKFRSTLLQEAVRLYGIDQFEFRPLKEFPPEEVALREAEAIRRLKPALNIKKPGYDGTEGSIHVETIRARRKRGVPEDRLFDPPHRTIRSANRYLVDGELLTVDEIAAKCGVPAGTIYNRVARGLTGKALTMRQGVGRPRKMR